MKFMKDTNELAHSIVGKATGQLPPDKKKNQAAVELGRLGGLKGGRARFAKMTDKEKSELGKKAARSRWNAPKTEKDK